MGALVNGIQPHFLPLLPYFAGDLRAARDPEVRSIRNSSAADGVTDPVQYVDSREADVPTASANALRVRPLASTSSRTRAATAALSWSSAPALAAAMTEVISGPRTVGLLV
jgi:hypothetical protein